MLFQNGMVAENNFPAPLILYLEQDSKLSANHFSNGENKYRDQSRETSLKPISLALW
jgi:hypothetical protein